MSFNIYNEEEEQRLVCEYQLDNSERDYSQMMDQYYTTSQSPQQSKWSIKRVHTGQSKRIRKIKQQKKYKSTSQYDSEGKNYILSKDSLIEEGGDLDFQQKEVKMIVKKMKQLNLK